MNNKTNIFLAAFSSVMPILQAIDTQKLIPIISAIVLPVLFFCIGKAVDVGVQIYLRRQENKSKDTNKSSPSEQE